MPITTGTLHTMFNRIIDEVATDVLSSADRDRLINDAQIILFNQLFHPKKQGNEAQDAFFESSMPVSQYLWPFTKKLDSTMTAGGEIARSALDTLASRTVAFVTGISLNNTTLKYGYRDARWRTRAELNVQQDLVFFKPSTCNPWFSFRENKILIYPTNVLYAYRADVILHPLNIVYGSVDSEFDASLAPWIVYKAAQLGAMSLRDNEYVKQIQAQVEGLGV